jgi:hypothetical protein
MADDVVAHPFISVLVSMAVVGDREALAALWRP